MSKKIDNTIFISSLFVSALGVALLIYSTFPTGNVGILDWGNVDWKLVAVIILSWLGGVTILLILYVFIGRIFGLKVLDNSK